MLLFHLKYLENLRFQSRGIALPSLDIRYSASVTEETTTERQETVRGLAC